MKYQDDFSKLVAKRSNFMFGFQTQKLNFVIKQYYKTYL